MNAIQFVARNWKLLLVVFGISGSLGVWSVLPQGTPGHQEVTSFGERHLDAVKGQLVSTTVE